MSSNPSGTIEFQSGVSLGVNNDRVGLFNLPTLNVARPGNISLTGVQALNFIGAVSVILQSATAVRMAAILFVNTSGSGPVSLKLDNGGTIGGKSVFSLASGQAVTFAFDGTNFS